MQPEIGLPVNLQRQQRGLADRQIGANGLVICVSGGINRHDQIIGIVAAKEKYAHQRFVIRAALGHGADQPELAESADHRRRSRGAACQP